MHFGVKDRGSIPSAAPELFLCRQAQTDTAVYLFPFLLDTEGYYKAHSDGEENIATSCSSEERNARRLNSLPITPS
jgi:hypothetical protein